MKLYTEGQIREALNDNFNFGDRAIDFALSKLTPIELPNDEEIYDKSNTIDIEGLSWEVRLARDFFNDGAKWVIEKIKQQDNDTNTK